MRIVVATPAAARSRAGNRHTAQCYASFLRGAALRVHVGTELTDVRCDLLIALLGHLREDPAFYDRLRRATTARGRMFTPAAERRGVPSVVREAVRMARF